MDKQTGYTQELVLKLSTLLIQKNLSCAVAESCTGGLIAAELTACPGSSQWFDCGCVTYSNSAKHDLLGVSQSLLETHGAVSEATVKSMAEGMLHHSKAQVSVAVSGIAGPGGGTLNKPVGTIWMAWASPNVLTQIIHYQLTGSRHSIRQQCVVLALKGLIQYCKNISQN